MTDDREHRFQLLPRRQVAAILLALLATWAGIWLLLALLTPLTADPKPVPPGFFLAMLPLLLLVAAGPIWGLGGTLVVTFHPDRLVVRRDRPGKPGAPLVVPLPPGARVLFCVQRPTRRKQRNQGILHVEVDGRLNRLADTAAHDVFTAIAATLNAASTRTAHP